MGRAASETQIAGMAANLDPARLNTSPEADRGAPIVGPDGVIESGNARVQAIRRAYAQHPERAQAYRDMIQAQGHRIPAGMAEPVLIRRRTTELSPEDRQAFVHEANTPATLAMSPAEQARADARHLDPETLGKLNPALTGGLNAAGNRDFVRSYLGKLPEPERAKLIDANGGLNQDGLQRVQRAVLARAYGDPRAIERMTESTNDETKAITGALIETAPGMAQVRGEIERGKLPASLDISQDIIRAADLTRQAREKGQSPGDILTQADVFNPISPAQEQLVRAFHNAKMTRGAGRERIAKILRAYTQEALKQTTNDLAGGSKLDPAAFIQRARESLAPEAEPQGGLFGPTQGAKPPNKLGPPPPAGPPPTTDIGRNRAELTRKWLDELHQQGPGHVAGTEALNIERSRRVGTLETQVGKDGGPTPEQASWARRWLEWDQTREDNAAAALKEAPPEGFDPSVGGNTPRDTHHTERPAHNIRQVFAETGVADPDAAVSRPAAAQVHVLSRAVASKYGLAGVDIAPGANPRETIDQLADAHFNLQSMAAVMGVPNNTIGLRGTLRIWLGPRGAPEVDFGGNRALGVYRPDNRTIYMPGRSNSFAHEWTHALDHALVGQLQASPQAHQLLSRLPATWAGNPARSSLQAFARLMGTIYGRDAASALAYLHAVGQAQAAPTPLNRNRLQAAQQAFRASRFYNKARSAGGAFGTYLSQPYELLARSHEAFIGHEVSNAFGAERGGTEFLAKPEVAYLTQADRALSRMYPDGDERNAIFQAWRDLHRALRDEALYPGGRPANLPRNDLGGLGPDHWKQWADPQANAALAAALRAQANQHANRAGLLANALRDVGLGHEAGAADPGYLTRWVRHTDAVRLMTQTPRGMLNTIHARVPPRAQRALRGLIDQLTTDPGSGRHVAQTYEEEVHANGRRDNNAYAKIAYANAIVSPYRVGGWRGPRMDETTRETFHQLVTQSMDMSNLPENVQKAVRDNRINSLGPADQGVLRSHWDRQSINAPANLKRFASDVRFALDKRYYELRQAGIEIPYTDGYFPRMYDDHRIYTQPDAFERDAARVKSIQVQHDTEDDGEGMVATFRAVRGALDPADGDRINQVIAQQRRDNARNNVTDPTAEHMIPDRADRQLVWDAWGRAAAQRWREAVLMGDPTRYDTRGPRTKPLRQRTLPPEADAIMRRWLVTDPHAVVPHYMHQTNRLIAFARRFGRDGREIDTAIRGMVEGGMQAQDATLVRHLTEMITGRQSKAREFSQVTRLLEGVHAIGTMALMPRAVWSALAEPMAVLPRTGSLRATYEGFAQAFREIARTGDAQRTAEVAQYLGLVTSSIFDSVGLDRTGATYTDGENLGALMTNYFRVTGLTAITNMQRRGALVSGSWYLRQLTRDLAGTPAARREALAQLRNLGIEDAHADDFGRWLSGITQNVPDIAQLEGHRNGDLFGAAMVRFTDEVNQAPKTSERPIMANDPRGRLVFGLTSFLYAFMNNVVGRFLRNTERMVHETPGAGAKAGVLGRMMLLGAGSVAAMTLAQLVSTIPREALLNPNTWDDRAEKGELWEWLGNLAFQRVGMNGPLDPIVQAINGLKYQRSLSELFAGAQLGWFLDAAEKMLQPLTNPSPHTNTADFNALTGAYNLLAVPALALGLTAMGRVVPGLPGAAMQTLTSKRAAEGFASLFVGPKGSGDETTAPQDPAASMEAEIERELQTDKKENQSSVGASGVMGAADDLLPFIARNIGRVPGPLRWAGAAAGVGWAGKSLADEFARFSQPPPEHHTRK